ncbi:YdeI family protein [Olivibacter sp. CPCC 100613]|uniref:YdeI/OmpD-associated family protein n=1 Tax=Olivibacter sp. CPCC 100613 TaxID=3079931 RepID=UPI002FF76EC7
MNPNVDFFFNQEQKWQNEFRKLRRIILDCQLTEELKWGNPCYTLQTNPPYNQQKNIVLIHGFKEYCALLFFKGALLHDTDRILIQQTENVQAARQIRFTHVQQIMEMELLIKAYVYEAVEIEKAGLKVHFKKTKDFAIPEEFQDKLAEIPTLKAAFEALTPGRQRAYIVYFSQPKLHKTRIARIEKYMPLILNGKGLNDSYF